MNTKHTPGPWLLKSDPSHFDTATSVVAGRENDHGWSHLMIEVGGLAGLEETEANARLIAASPELLTALVEMLHMFKEHENCGDDEATSVKLARSAIAKATGEDAP